MVQSDSDNIFLDAVRQYREELSEFDRERTEKAVKRLRKDTAFRSRRNFCLDFDVVDRELPKAASMFYNNNKLHLLAKGNVDFGGWLQVREAADNLQSAISRLQEPWRSLLDIKLEEQKKTKQLKRRSQLNLLGTPLSALKVTSSLMIDGATKLFKRRLGRPTIRADVENATPLLMKLWIDATSKPINASFDLAGPDEYRNPGIHFVHVILTTFDKSVTRAEVRTAIEHARDHLG